ncbi:MAG: hypothetical protein AAF399_25340 [Bacteroidota bacterium]
MSHIASVQRIIRITRPRAKFVNVSHSSEFIPTSSHNLFEKGFYSVHLYDEQIDSNVVKTPYGMVMIHNTYLASFAYNLLLCWVVGNDRVKYPALSTSLPDLLKHNFKKFYAEQLISRYDHVFSRAMFLETLLFEQVQMVPVFAARAEHAELDNIAELASHIMSSLVSFHELGHLLLEQKTQSFSTILAESPLPFRTCYQQIENQYPPAFLAEVQCDWISILSCWQEYQSKLSPVWLLQSIAFGFAGFAVMSSLLKSAEATVRDLQQMEIQVDHQSIAKQHREISFSLGKDRDMIERATLVIQLCEQIANQQNDSIWHQSTELNLPSSLLDDLTTLVDYLVDSTDSNARSMSLLVAEALEGHPSGTEFLYLRSKTFQSQREIPSNPYQNS